MNKLRFPFLTLFLLILLGCSSNDDVVSERVSITFNFNHFWGEDEIETSDFGNTTYTNSLGTEMIIDRFRYVISDISLTHVSGEVTNLKEYNLVDVNNESGLSFTTSESILPGEYSSVTFRFGFSEEDNTDGAYVDLTSANFDVPSNLGGGYHYMQMDGFFTDSNNTQSSFAFHAISAIDTSVPVDDRVREDTSLNFSVGSVSVQSTTNINVSVDLSGWFEAPNEWDLNALNNMLMGNYEAQQDMFENAQSGVFGLINVTQE